MCRLQTLLVFLDIVTTIQSVAFDCKLSLEIHLNRVTLRDKNNQFDSFLFYFSSFLFSFNFQFSYLLINAKRRKKKFFISNRKYRNKWHWICLLFQSNKLRLCRLLCEMICGCEVKLYERKKKKEKRVNEKFQSLFLVIWFFGKWNWRN